MRNYKVTYEPTYKGHPITTNKEKGWGCHTEIIDKSLALLEHGTEAHNKELFFTYVLRYPTEAECPANNRDVKKFMGTYVKGLTRDGLDPLDLWVREQATSDHQHYHCLTLVDGAKRASAKPLLDHAEECWNRVLGVPLETKGLVDRCTTDYDGRPQTNGVMLRRGADDFDQTFDDCVRRSAYIAKLATKGNVPSRVRQYGGTELPKSSNVGGVHENG